MDTPTIAPSRSFLEDSHFTSIHVLSRNSSSHPSDNFDYHTGDILDAKVVQAVIEQVQPRVVVHCVAPPHSANEQTQRKITIRGTSNVLKCALSHSSVEALIYTSTCQVVKQTGIELTEESGQVLTDADKVNPYVKCKALAETMVLKANGKSLRTVSLKNSRLRRGEHKFQIGDNSALRAFIYIEDAARAHVLASKALLHGGQAQTDPKVDGEAFFITDGTAEPIFVVQFGRKPVMTLRWRRLQEPELRRHDLEYLRNGCFVSIQKARERLGFEPLVDRPEGIRRGVKWALEQESKTKKDT
ncbi:hypothetical protein EAF04_005690 [Stromatinia cepivora]|nr:hypothetical protein EAF04_005690 [Stromatinia cepivora]